MSKETIKQEYLIYEIKINGHLDSKWSDWFENMDITYQDNVTVLCGPLPDQTALHSILNQIRDMNLSLISVNCIQSCRNDNC